MTPEAPASVEGSSNVLAVAKNRRRYFVAVMLLLMVTLGYVDRVNMSVAAPLLAEELGLSPAALGLLFSVFLWSYTALLVPVGWLTNRYIRDPSPVANQAPSHSTKKTNLAIGDVTAMK